MRQFLCTTALVFLLTAVACKNLKENEPKKSTSQSSDTFRASTETLDSAEIKATWREFVNIITTKDHSAFRQLSLDSIRACHTRFHVSKFIDDCFNKIFDSVLLQNISDGRINFNLQAKIHQVQVVKKTYQEGGIWTMTFDFAKTNTGYKFSECDSFGGPTCCR